MASHSPPPEEPSTKRLRTTEIQSSEPGPEPDLTEAPETSSPKSVCAICFNDDGIACRGEIDCCDHYFCFFCIMEWSKSESRCPVCRRRFSTIRRPPKPGVFSGERMISITHKDQACEAINVDMYAEISCTVCHGSENDYLLLLCDLCDSASHSYCVGLGATVPEGDWFCHDCSVCRAEQHFEESELGSQGLSLLKAKRKPAKKKKMSRGWARTLMQSRSVRSRVRAIRDNWDTFRSGDLSFSVTSSAESPSTEIKRVASRVEVSTSASTSTSTSAPSNPANRQVSRDPDAFISYDVSRAWKMFAMAKPPMKSQTGGINIASEASGSRSCLLTVWPPKPFLPAVRQNVNESSSSNGSTSVVAVKQSVRSRGHDDDMKCEIQSLVKLKPKLFDGDKRLGTKENNRMKEQCISKALGSRSCLPTVGSLKSVRLNVNETSSSANGSASISVVKQQTPGSSDVRLKINESIGFHKERGHDSMKSEIQSLVKLNLKLLDRDKRLGVDSFKKMAQIATHTVMASCGLDHHEKYAVLSFQGLACSHVKHPTRQVSNSDAIPTCQKCLNSFVKNVVQSIMFEKDPNKRRSSE